jgi:GNAT superfamily N-acetyltransferase
MKLVIRPLTRELWPALEDLFGPNGATCGCWCMYWRLGSAYQRNGREKNKAAFRAIVRRGPPPGLVAFEGGRAVAWCQLTPRVDLPALDRSRLLKRADEMPVWSISCFYVRKGYRSQGITAKLIEAAIKEARRAKAPALEAYPVDEQKGRRASGYWTGRASTFRRAGFQTVVSRAPHRPVMRHDLSKYSD